MAKQKNDYFKLMEQQIACCSEASRLLEQVFSHYSTELLPEQRDTMHAIEHRADEIHHDILTRLSSEFITPIDQEDILRIVQIIDDVTDALDEVLLECYMFHIHALPSYASALSGVVGRCVDALEDAVKELKNFKKPETLRTLIVKVNTIESEADAIYAEAIHSLFASESDCKRLIGSQSVYDCLENCCDLCEHAADVIELIIIKNT